MKKSLLPSISFALLLSFVFISCGKELSNENFPVSGGTARYSFDGGTASCTGATLSGTFTAGTPASTANRVTLSVNVDSVGSYIISTNTINGISFSGSGVFTSTGIQDITLTASGTPASYGTFDFVPGANGCTFNVTVNSSGGGSGGGSGSGGGGSGGGGGTSGNFLRCKIDGVLTNFNTGLVGYYVPPPFAGIPYSISVQGKNSDVAGSLEEFWVSVTNPTSPTTGAYKNRTFTTGATDRGSQVIFYPTGFPNLYWGSSAFKANTSVVNISSVSTSAAAGTFSGTIYDTNGGGTATKQVTAGEFKITF